MATTRAFKDAMAGAVTPDEARKVLHELVNANRQVRVDCRCGQRKLIEVIDARTRLEAVKTALDYGMGKPAQQKPETELPTDLAEIARLSDGDLARLAAA